MGWRGMEGSQTAAGRYCRGCTALLLLLTPAATHAGVRLPAGTVVRLELQQTVSSAYTQTDAAIYLRVKEDIQGDGHVLIEHGALAIGRLIHLQDRQRMGQSGTFSYDVHFVPAVDGQNIRVIASANRAGRDREDALATDIILWGVFGLLTHGANAWIERGSILEAQGLSDRQIDVERAPQATPALPVAAYHGTSGGHAFEFGTSKTVELNLEKSRKMEVVRFRIRPDPGLAAGGTAGNHWVLASLDGAPLPEPGAGERADDKGVAFDAWSVLQYCHDGDNNLGFRTTLGDNSSMEASDTVNVHLVRRK